MTTQQINTALASFGMSGLVFHGPLLTANSSFHLSAILERTKNEAVKKYPGVSVFRNYEELCRDDGIELIVVNTPDHLHYEMARLALEHGKHVVVEKPFTQSFAQARGLIDLARKNNLILSVFQNRRWDGDFMTVKEVIEKGLLGRLVFFESHFDRYRNFIQEGTWKEESSSGSGILFNLGSHMIDQALDLFGTPLSVFADLRTMRSGGQVDDSYDIWMEYPDVQVKLCSSYLVREPGPRYILHGTEGSFLKWGIDPQEEALKAGILPKDDAWGEEAQGEWGLLHTSINGKAVRERYKTIPGNYNIYYNNIYQAIRAGQPLAVTAEQAALVVRVIEACMDSSRLRRVIPISFPF